MYLRLLCSIGCIMAVNGQAPTVNATNTPIIDEEGARWYQVLAKDLPINQNQEPESPQKPDVIEQILNDMGSETEKFSQQIQPITSQYNYLMQIAANLFGRYGEKLQNTVEKYTTEQGRLTGAFEDAGIVPRLIDRAPTSALEVIFRDGDSVQLGNMIQPRMSEYQPSTIRWATRPDQLHTLMAIHTDRFTSGSYLDHLIINIPGDRHWLGETVAPYIGASTTPNNGVASRPYIYLLFEQTGSIQWNRPTLTDRSMQGRSPPVWNARSFINDNFLGTPIAGNFYRASCDEYSSILSQRLGEPYPVQC